MNKRKAYPGSLYDFYGVEQWLTQLAREGFRLEGFSRFGSLGIFRQEEPKSVRYHVEPDLSQYRDKEEDCTLGEEWNLVCKVSGVFLVYESDDLWVSKPEKWKIEEKQLRKKLRNLWLSFFLWIVTIGLTGLKLIVELFPEQVAYIDWLTMLPLVLFSGVLLAFVEFWKGLPSLYDIWVWRRSFLMEEEIEQQPIMAVFRWGEQFIWVIALVAALLSVVVSAQTTRNSFELERFDDPLPLVTLDMLEEESHYVPEPLGAEVIVSVEKSLLVPEDIIIRSDGMFEMPSDSEAPGELNDQENYRAKLNFHYYRLRGESMAERLAEDEAGGRHSARLERKDFDQLWLWDKQDGWQYLVARERDVVIVISYYGGSCLEEHLTEIYETVTEYRNR